VTLPQPARDLFWTRAGELGCAKPAIRELRNKQATWCRPELRVTARHLRGGDMIRHATQIAVPGCSRCPATRLFRLPVLRCRVTLARKVTSMRHEIVAKPGLAAHPQLEGQPVYVRNMDCWGIFELNGTTV